MPAVSSSSKDATTPVGSNGVRKGSVSTEGEDSMTETLAERRALHNSVERTRREALNSKFTHLAQQLPSLSHIHRPSKSVIISHCLDMVVDLKETKAENETLKQELFHMRLSIQGVTQPPSLSHRSQLRLNVPQDVLASSRGYETLDSNASPRQLQRRHDRSPLIPASPRNFRAPYPTSLPGNYHHRSQVRSHSRHSLPGGPSLYQDKGTPSSLWQGHDSQSRLRLQPETYPVPDYAMVNEHFTKVQPESNHSSSMNESAEDGNYAVPSAFFPSEYGHGSYEVNGQQQSQYLVKSEDSALV